MAVYAYSKVAVYAELGGAVRVARNARVTVTDAVTGDPVNVTQGSVTAAYLDTDANGVATFTAEHPGPLRLTAGTMSVDVYSNELPGIALDAVTAAEAAQVAAEEAAASATAPTDTTVAALLGTASATRTAADARYQQVGSYATDAELAAGLADKLDIADAAATYIAYGTAALDFARAALSASVMVPVHVVICGDSYIAGQDATTDARRFVNITAARLQAAFPAPGGVESSVAALSTGYSSPPATAGVHVFNGAVGGTASNDYLTSTTRGYINTLAPKIVVHVIGTNDLAVARSKADYKANIAAQIAGLTTPNLIHILVHGALRPDAPWEAAHWAEYKDALDELAAASPATVASVDISAAFFAANATNGADPLNLMTDGGIHPTDSGQALMAAEFMRILGIPGLRALPSATYTPALTAATTNPTLGTGAIQTGRWGRVGPMVVVWFRIKFGTSGVAQGSGAYRISLPVPALAGIDPAGTVKLIDATGGFHAALPVALITTTTVAVQYAATYGGAVGSVYDAGPWTWAANDELAGFLIYPAATPA